MPKQFILEKNLIQNKYANVIKATSNISVQKRTSNTDKPIKARVQKFSRDLRATSKLWAPES
jgi:hypothetical protein